MSASSQHGRRKLCLCWIHSWRVTVSIFMSHNHSPLHLHSTNPSTPSFAWPPSPPAATWLFVMSPKAKLHPALHQSSSTTRTHAVYHPVSHRSRQCRHGSSLPIALFLLPHCTIIPLVHHSCCCPFQIWRKSLILCLFQHDWLQIKL